MCIRDSVITTNKNRKSKNKNKISKKETASNNSINKEFLEKQFSSVFKKFETPTEADNNESKSNEQRNLNHIIIEHKKPLNEKPKVELSKNKLRKISKPTLSQLKSSVAYPQLIEWFDCDSTSPYLLTKIKTSKNVVPVPSHWQMKREYLSGRSLLTKKPFELPDIIKQTDIEQMRVTLPSNENMSGAEGDEKEKSLKEMSRARVQPKLGQLDIDYKKLHDIFFKLGSTWKPGILLPFGDMYYENRNLTEETEWKKLVKTKRPGKLSKELRDIMKLQDGQLPPWCVKMQKIGMPPAYPGMKVAGINWDISNLKDGVYGKLTTVAGTKRKTAYFGQIISFDTLESDVEDEGEEEEEEKIFEKTQLIDKKSTEVNTGRNADATTPFGTIEENTGVPREKNTTNTSPKQLYKVLKEREVSATATPSYIITGDSDTNISEKSPIIPQRAREEENEKEKEKEEEEEDIKSFKF